MDATLRALADPQRRHILHLIRDREVPAGEIARAFTISRPAVSQHLAVLRAAGLVHERRDGTKRLYRARPEGAAELRAWLEAFSADGLDRLREAAEAEARIRATDEDR